MVGTDRVLSPAHLVTRKEALALARSVLSGRARSYVQASIQLSSYLIVQEELPPETEEALSLPRKHSVMCMCTACVEEWG